MAIDSEKVELKLTSIAQLAEDLSAELYSESPNVARKFGKIAAYCRKIATCVRLHGQVPIGQDSNPVAKTVRYLGHIANGVKTIADQLPRIENDD